MKVPVCGNQEKNCLVSLRASDTMSFCPVYLVLQMLSARKRFKIGEDKCVAVGVGLNLLKPSGNFTYHQV
jgi:hypothetical protein